MKPQTNSNGSAAEGLLKLLEAANDGGLKELLVEVLNQIMLAERQDVLRAAPYERTEARQGYANGFKKRGVSTSLGGLNLTIPQVRGGIEFRPQTLDAATRSEQALKLAVAEMYLQGVSTRKVKRITEELCGLELSSTTVSRLTQTLDEELEAFRTRELGEYRYMLLDARYEKVRYCGQVRDLAVLIAIGINTEGRREVLGVSASLSEAEVHWREFLESLVERGLRGLELITSDDHAGLKAARQAVFGSVAWQRCQFHFAQNAQHYVPKLNMREEIGKQVRWIFAADCLKDARQRVAETVRKYAKSAPKFTEWLESDVEECFAVYAIPDTHRKRLRTVNGLENINREIRRRTRVATLFPNVAAVLRLVTAILAEIHEDWMTAPMAYVSMK